MIAHCTKNSNEVTRFLAGARNPTGQQRHSGMQEMCYQFTISYPYGALNNGVISLIGATNTCW